MIDPAKIAMTTPESSKPNTRPRSSSGSARCSSVTPSTSTTVPPAPDTTMSATATTALCTTHRTAIGIAAIAMPVSSVGASFRPEARRFTSGAAMTPPAPSAPSR